MYSSPVCITTLYIVYTPYWYTILSYVSKQVGKITTTISSYKSTRRYYISMEQNLKKPSSPKKKKVIKKKRKQTYNFHLIFFIVVIVLFIFAIVKLLLWNKGEDSGYDPNEITTEFDVETMDHIQPMDTSRFESIEDDGVTTILCLGNSPFADNKGESGLAQTLARKMNGVAYDGSFANSFQTMYNKVYQDTYRPDGLSLYSIANAISSGDFSIVESTAATVGESELQTARMLKNLDYSTVDMLVIMYDLSDYIKGRPLYNETDPNDPITWTGSLNASLELIEKAYPHIRTIILSMPACGVTVDGYYIDGDKQNLGNGTIPDYLNYEMNVVLANGVSYIDNYYGVITVENKDEYLVNEYHLNEKGIEAIADRFYYFFGDSVN